MPLLDSPVSDSILCKPSPDPWERVRVWRLRFVPVRATLAALVAMAIGVWIAHRVNSSVTADEIREYVLRHTEGDTTATAAWLRLCTAQIPLYVLLFCAGLTRFSGALSNGVLLVAGMTDGATLALLWNAASFDLAPAALPVAYLLRAVAELVLRVYLATAACRLARHMDDRDRGREGSFPLRRLLVHYVAAFVSVIAALAVACLGYVLLAF